MAGGLVMEDTQTSNLTESTSIGRKRPFVCSECGKAYSEQKRLGKHTRMQHQREYQTQDHEKVKEPKAHCGICNEEITAFSIPKHIECVHKQTMMSTCKECGVEVSQSSLFQHQLEVHGAVKCLLCGRKFGSKLSHTVHISSAHCRLLMPEQVPFYQGNHKRRRLESEATEGSSGYVCGICEQSFASGYRLYRHLLQHSRKVRAKEWICSKCWTVAPDIEVLKHKQECKMRKPTAIVNTSIGSKLQFTCIGCGKVFASRHHATIHTKTAHKDQNLQFSEGNLQANESNSSISPSPMISTSSTPRPGRLAATCGICSKNIQYNDMARHMEARHDFTLSSVCEQCGVRVNNYILLQHMQETHGRVECYLCTRKFASVHSYVTHFYIFHCIPRKSDKNDSRIDIGRRRSPSSASQEFPLICGICEQTFTDSSGLYRHIIRHTRVIPRDSEVCLWCGLVLPIVEVLEHRRQHDGELCKKCGEVFASRVKLCAHVRHIHSDCD